MLYRLILPSWIKEQPDYDPSTTPGVVEADLTLESMLEHNEVGYQCYYLPNYPKSYDPESTVDGSMIDTFEWVFVDLDMKDYQSPSDDRRHNYETKESFVETLLSWTLPPTKIIDSGNGIHAYWRILDLTDQDFLRLQRRLCRHFHTDPAVSKLYQLMRVPGTINWKNPDDLKLAQVLSDNGVTYTAEQLSSALPRLSEKDENYCKNHYDKTHGLSETVDVSDELPGAWFKFAKPGTEAYKLFYGAVRDRSAADYRLAHLMLAASFTKEEAMTVLCQTNKATERVGIHRYNYAEGIVSKVWLNITDPDKAMTLLSRRVRDILGTSSDETLKGTRFECNDIVDATEHGFRLTQVLGLIAGAGAGKTMFGLNLFRWFVERNPDYVHLAVSLEQPELEYSQRWKKMSGGNPVLLDAVYVLGNYSEDGTYRNLSLQDIEDHVKCLEKETGKKVGCVMIDHIGVLKREDKNGDRQGLVDICQYMKAFAVNTNTFLLMQSQTNRDKAGNGDVELDKDAAYGTSNFEWFCDYIVTLWQPLKRIYAQRPDMTITCFKFCKIRHKNTILDRIKEDERYALKFDPSNDLLRQMTSEEYQSFEFLSKKATVLRNQDKKREPGRISAIDWTKTEGGKPNERGNTTASRGPGNLSSSQRLPIKH